MKKDILILIQFINAYCANKHKEYEKSIYSNPYISIDKKIVLCRDCTSLANYSIERRANCPYEKKPSCKNCATKCYSKEYRSKIKEVMKFSGIYFIIRGRIDYLIKYFF